MAEQATDYVNQVLIEEADLRRTIEAAVHDALTGERTEVRRSDLVAMGYDRKLVFDLPISTEDDSEAEERRDFDAGRTEAQKANEPLDYYDLFIRLDTDGDGISELRHMVFAGGLSEKNLLVDEEAEEVQFCDVAVMRQPHQWEGISLADDLADIQRGKTVLLRQTLDNIYWQNNPQPIVQRGVVENLDAVMAPEFGQPIYIREGIPAGDAYTVQRVPFVAAQSFAMLDYLDAEASDRTGVSDASAGLAPDVLQGMTATASAMIEQAGIGETEMMVRTIADGLRPLFRGILKLIVKHQDVPRTVRLRGEWVQFDPRTWNSDMDCEVNTGLGAGTRERDLMVMQQVLALQEKLLGAFGPSGNPFVKAPHLYASLSKLVESAGLRTPSTYFHEPTPEEIQAIEKAQQSQPSEADIKAQEVQAKLQAHMAEQEMIQTTAAMREQAQLQADLTVKRAEIEAEAARQQNELASKAALKEQEIAWEREKFSTEVALRQAEMQARREDARMQAQARAIRPYLVPDDAA
ncbi:hypothetical protein [Paracoccus sp. S-4012]|uniref:portal protein n=1 Tax=Paracoccus sp. S-4012 TaxID=2665648 RepID=UPI001E43705E|nr:hypothetical protein [Paracoccus sp. S-4012]